jgi:hypothetical protein
MSDPTSTMNTKYQVDKSRQTRVIKNAEALVIGSYLAHNLSLGKAEFADDAASLIPLGVLVTQRDGDNLNLTGDSSGTYGVVARGGIVVEKVAVTGASAITDIGKFVYCTDGQTLSLTRPTTGCAYGIVTQWYSSTTCEVYLFDFIEGVLMSALGKPTKEILSLGLITSGNLEGTGALNLLAYTSYRHFTIDSMHCKAVTYDAGLIAGAQALTAKIGSTAITGAAIALGFADCDAGADLGVAVNSSTITAANEVHQGDVITVLLTASGTGFTAAKHGTFECYAVITNLPGA